MGQGVSIPYTMIAETAALADQVNANFAAIQAKFQGGIVDGDLSTFADLDGNKLSQTPGKQIPTAAIADNAVTGAKIISDAAIPGSDSNRAIAGKHIQLLVLADVARIVPAASLGKDKLKLTIGQKVAAAIAIAAGLGSGSVAPTVAIPVASNTLIACPWADSVVPTGGTVNSFGVVAANVAGNWQAVVYITGSAGLTSVQFTLNWAYFANS